MLPFLFLFSTTYVFQIVKIGCQAQARIELTIFCLRDRRLTTWPLRRVLGGVLVDIILCCNWFIESTILGVKLYILEKLFCFRHLLLAF